MADVDPIITLDETVYVPVEPVKQYKGTDPITGILTYYKMDAGGVIIARYNDSKKLWELAETIGQIPRPEDLVDAITGSDKEQLADALLKTEMFKPKTEYIIIGDEPEGGSGVVNLKTLLSAEDYDSLKTYLTLMPRQMLWDFFMKKIHPNLPEKPMAMAAGGGGSAGVVKEDIYGGYHYQRKYEDLVWAAFIDLFNIANLEYVNQQKMEPWDWETKKMDAYYVSQSKEAIDKLATDLEATRDISLAADPEARKIMEAYLTLPKLGDPGFEVNRQNAVKELLKKKDYKRAQAVIDAFRYINDSVLGEQIAKPLPYDVADSSGRIVAKASQ